MSPAGDLLYVNTLDGEYNASRPARMTIRTVELTTLTKVLEAALAAGGLPAVETAYRSYGEDPVRGKENTVAEMVAYGYRLLSGGQPAEALEIFRLNAAGNPGAAAAQYQLGEAYRYTGQIDPAVDQYRKTLALEPEHALASSRLVQLGAD